MGLGGDVLAGPAGHQRREQPIGDIGPRARRAAQGGAGPAGDEADLDGLIGHGVVGLPYAAAGAVQPGGLVFDMCGAAGGCSFLFTSATLGGGSGAGHAASPSRSGRALPLPAPEGVVAARRTAACSARAMMWSSVR